CFVSEETPIGRMCQGRRLNQDSANFDCDSILGFRRADSAARYDAMSERTLIACQASTSASSRASGLRLGRRSTPAASARALFKKIHMPALFVRVFSLVHKLSAPMPQVKIASRSVAKETTYSQVVLKEA
ncbi:MAG TPA: hypothetical protein DDW52_06495, partial [Planctomycetaceae bacterium]|nr:hypothetical protein [Planctomycetaceae bacterium]